MDIKQIQELVKLVKKAELCELKLRDGNFAISIKNKGGDTVSYTQPVVVTQAATPQATSKTTAVESKQETAPTDTKAVADNVFTFRSPMVGTFYRKPGADKEPFVKVGDMLKSGDVLCIIEAMKLFNEIEFDGAEGRLVKILADDSSPVEYDQPLFLIEKV